MHWSNRVRSVGDAIIVRRMNVVEHVESSLHVPNGELVAIRCKERVNRGKVRSGGA